MGRRRKPIDIVRVKEDIRDGLLQAYVARGSVRYVQNSNSYEFGNVIYLKDVQTGEVVKIGEVVKVDKGVI